MIYKNPQLIIDDFYFKELDILEELGKFSLRDAKKKKVPKIIEYLIEKDRSS